MATQQTSAAARVLVAPSVILLFLWMIVPLAMTLYFSSLRYSLLDADNIGFVGLQNYTSFLSDPDFIAALINTLVLVVSVLVISVIGGILVALLMDQPVFGQNVLRLMVIAPFFVMPTVSALVWKNLLMNPDSGLFAWIARSLGFEPIVWFTNYPMLSVIIVVSWEWLPFASLILLTALQSLDEEQKEAAQLDGAGAVLLLLLHRAAAYRARDHGGDPDRDDLPAQRVRGDLRHDRRRPGRRDDQHSLPRLQAGAAQLRRRGRLGGRHHRGGARQHRRDFPDADHRPEPGGLSDGEEAYPSASGSA